MFFSAMVSEKGGDLTGASAECRPDFEDLQGWDCSNDLLKPVSSHLAEFATQEVMARLKSPPINRLRDYSSFRDVM